MVIALEAKRSLVWFCVVSNKRPSTLRVEQKFNTTTELLLQSEFYEWAVDNGFFTQANFSAGIT
jgi:hypothetical protein